MLVILHQEHYLSSLVSTRLKKQVFILWPGNATLTHCRPTNSTFRQIYGTLTTKCHHEYNWSKATSSLSLTMRCKTRKYTKYCTTTQRTNTKTLRNNGSNNAQQISKKQNHPFRTDSSYSHLGYVGALIKFYWPNRRPRFCCCKYTILF